MPSKRVKSLFSNPDERNHRQHRSKRGQRADHWYKKKMLNIRKQIKLKKEEKEINNIIKKI